MAQYSIGADILAQSLDMHLHIVPARRKLRCFRGELVDSFSSLAVLTRFAIRSACQLELPSSVTDGGRTAQFCTLDIAGKSVLVVNSHLSHLTPLEGGGTLRAEQLRTILNKATQMPLHDVTLLCGDFNASMDSPELSPFMQPPWSLVDTYAQSGGGEKFTYLTSEGHGLNLDHILCLPSCSSSPLGCLAASVVLNAPGVLASDHSGVSITFGLS